MVHSYPCLASCKIFIRFEVWCIGTLKKKVLRSLSDIPRMASFNKWHRNNLLRSIKFVSFFLSFLYSFKGRHCLDQVCFNVPWGIHFYRPGNETIRLIDSNIHGKGQVPIPEFSWPYLNTTKLAKACTDPFYWNIVISFKVLCLILNYSWIKISKINRHWITLNYWWGHLKAVRLRWVFFAKDRKDGCWSWLVLKRPSNMHFWN